jgi:hypothetical protein
MSELKEAREAIQNETQREERLKLERASHKLWDSSKLAQHLCNWSPHRREGGGREETNI